MKKINILPKEYILYFMKKSIKIFRKVNFEQT